MAVSHVSAWCGRDEYPHDHELIVKVTLEGPRGVRGYDTISKDLRALANEMDGRDLVDVMPGSDGSLWALAARLHERLAQTYPAVVEVSVRPRGGSIIVKHRRD